MYTDQYKYTAYSEGQHREILIDLSSDSDEMNNLVTDSQYRTVQCWTIIERGWCIGAMQRTIDVGNNDAKRLYDQIFSSV